MVDRILISPSVVRVSLPGVDVKNPPALTEEYLALDSSWPKVERLHAAGQALNQTMGAGGFSFFFPTLSIPPLATVQIAAPGTKTLRDVWITYAQFHIPYWYDHFTVETFTDRLVIHPSIVKWQPGLAEDGRNTPWDWYFFVFKL